MIVMTPEATEAEIAAVKERLETTGVHVLVLPGELTTAIGAIGDPEGVRELGPRGHGRRRPRGADLAAVQARLVRARPPRADGRSASTAARSAATDVLPDRRAVHGRVARADARGRARRWRPRAPRCCAAAPTSRARRRSRSRGSASRRCEILAEARAETGLPIVTEFLDTQHADAIAEYADVMQIGARNMQNYALLEVAGKLGKPVLLKRGLSSSLDELLMAADYILKEGNERDAVRARHPHVRDGDALHARPLRGAVAEAAHAPAGDRRPSHASGDRRLVEPLARAAAAVGADGIIVEVHQDPEAALCDGPQALYARDFAGFAERVAAHAALDGRRALLTRGEVRADERATVIAAPPSSMAPGR